MKPWTERPPEIANLLNPAFCGIILHEFCFSYQAAGEPATPFSLSFLALPITLPPSTRKTLTPRVRQLQTWVAENEIARVELARQVRDLLPFTKEAVSFLACRKLLSFTPTGGLLVGRRLNGSQRTDFRIGDRGEAMNAASKLGKLMALAGSPGTIFAQLGLQP